jgi:hypothetical protein
MHFRVLLTASCALLVTHAVPLSAFGQDVAGNKPASIAIVELFTSEGCSSCPPADELLRQINLKRTNAGQLILGISEHVTYWNNLGWRDPYSLPVFTERQSVYASRLSAEGSYTPQMVLNGRRDQFVGSNSGALQHALLDDSRRSHLALSILSTNRAPSGVDVTFSLKQSIAKPLDIIAVLTDDADRSTVLRGENGGRMLQHVSVARSLTRVATVKGDSEQSVHIPSPDGMQVDSNSGHHLILFAQEPHQGAVLGAATAPF